MKYFVRFRGAAGIDLQVTEDPENPKIDQWLAQGFQEVTQPAFMIAWAGRDRPNFRRLGLADRFQVPAMPPPAPEPAPVPLDKNGRPFVYPSNWRG